MLKGKKEKLLYNWRIWVLLVALAFSLWQIGPRMTESGLQTNLLEGFDLAGGTRVVLSPEEAADKETVQNAIVSLQNRLNIYGLKDISVQSASDLEGNEYVIVKASGMTKDDVSELLAKQGKFEQRIDNITVITGSDIVVESYKASIRATPDGGAYTYVLPLLITSTEAQRKFAETTENLTVSLDGDYLSSQMELYVDDELVDSLRIAADLKGKVIDNPVITGTSRTKEEAQDSMNRMSAILQSGALPIKLEVLSMDTVSPRLGRSFIDQILFAAVVVFVLTGVVIWLHYKDGEMTALMLLTTALDAVLVLGIAATIKWQLDLASIAGLVVGLGISVDQQLVVTDQIIKGELEHEGKLSLKQKLKKAGSILFASFGTSLTAMVPLMFASLGSLRGFAITSLLTEGAAYFVTRPAYLAALETEFR